MRNLAALSIFLQIASPRPVGVIDPTGPVEKFMIVQQRESQLRLKMEEKKKELEHKKTPSPQTRIPAPRSSLPTVGVPYVPGTGHRPNMPLQTGIPIPTNIPLPNAPQVPQRLADKISNLGRPMQERITPFTSTINVGFGFPPKEKRRE